jgi:hypothetical protein
VTDAKQQIRDRLNVLGPEQVRHLLSTGGFPQAWNLEISEWLGEEERKESRYQENLETMRMQAQLDVAKSARRAAWIGAYAAIAAAVLSLAAVIATIIYH